jgi:hypothetical protein
MDDSRTGYSSMLKTLFPEILSDMSFTDPNINGRVLIA